MPKIPVFSKKQIAVARRTNMYEYLQARGETFEKVSSKFMQHTLHDSLRANVKTGVVNWYSQGLNSYNNAINFVMTFYQEPYEQVVTELLEYQFSQQRTKTTNQERRCSKPIQKTTPFTLEKLSKAGNYDTTTFDDQGRDYLKSRHLSNETIQEFVDKKLVSSDNRHNILFKFSEIAKGQLGIPVGADIQGTYAIPLAKRIKTTADGTMELKRKYFKGIAENSHGNRGFLFGKNVDFRSPMTLFVTEAPIESLSLYELEKENLPANTWFLSLSGLKEETLWQTYHDLSAVLGTEEGEIVLAVNNDLPGRDFVKQIHQTYCQSETLKETTSLSLRLPPIEQGDWNECLEKQKTGKLVSRQVKQEEQKKAQALWTKQQQTQRQQEVSV